MDPAVFAAAVLAQTLREEGSPSSKAASALFDLLVTLRDKAVAQREARYAK